jgi:hypothetical protein
MMEREIYMKKRLLQLTVPAALLIYISYKIGSRYCWFGDTLSIILCGISITLMAVGLIYHGWCFGKGRNPYAK